MKPFLAIPGYALPDYISIEDIVIPTCAIIGCIALATWAFVRRKTMKLIDIKIIGYCILLFGLASVSLRPGLHGGTFKAWAIRELQSMPQQETYTRADMIDAMIKVARYSWNIAGTPPVGGGVVMLVGAILIDVGSRQKKLQKKAEPNITN